MSMLAFSSAALADQFYFSSPGSTTWNGVYVNPYTAVDNSQTQNNPLAIYCDDYNTDFSGNPTWNANVYTLTAGNMSNFKYGNTTSNYNVSLSAGQLSSTPSTTPVAFDRYLEAAWLDSQEAGSSQTQQIELAAAEWTLFVDTSHVDGLIAAINNTSGYAAAVYNYLQDAQAEVNSGYTAPGWDVIVSDGNSFPMQEFLVQGFSGETSTPEPAAVLLLGTIAAILGLTKSFRKRPD